MADAHFDLSDPLGARANRIRRHAVVEASVHHHVRDTSVRRHLQRDPMHAQRREATSVGDAIRAGLRTRPPEKINALSAAHLAIAPTACGARPIPACVTSIRVGGIVMACPLSRQPRLTQCAEVAVDASSGARTASAGVGREHGQLLHRRRVCGGRRGRGPQWRVKRWTWR